MIFFWLIAAIMVAIALAFVLPPLLQTSRQTSPGVDNEQSRKEANVDVYRDQLSELEADVANGIVSREQYTQDRDEIERRLLDDVSPPDATNKVREKKSTAAVGGRGPVYAIAVGIPVIAIALYLQVGNPAALSAPSGLSARPGSPAAVSQSQAPFAGGAQPSGQMTQQAIEANVAKLAGRLEQNPGDLQGWIMLGRSYVNLEKYREASNAYAKATALKPDDADLLGDYAFAMGMANGQRLQGQPVDLINKALKLDPENPKALELAGSAAFEVKNYSQAISYWQKLMQKTPPDSELAQALAQRITEAKSLAGTAAK
ncbi:MAG: c-type cytochrome biogenesis protein CcmI [Pyrinomonadaceae bacterium]